MAELDMVEQMRAAILSVRIQIMALLVPLFVSNRMSTVSSIPFFHDGADPMGSVYRGS